MSISATRGMRLLLAAAIAWLGLALCAQAAHATYAKVQVAKVNSGGNPADLFTFTPGLTPSQSAFTLKGGDASTAYQVECNVDRPGKAGECARWGYPTLKFTEAKKPGYTLTSVDCRYTQGTSSWPSAPTSASPVKPSNEVAIDLAAGTVSLKVHWYEWVKCTYTNTKEPDTGTIKVTKKVVAPAGDTGKFNLLIDGAIKAANIVDGGTTGTQTVAAGAHTVGESAGAGTNLGAYDASLVCEDKAHGGTDNDGALWVDKGDQWECVITNTRKVGTIKVTKKVVAPAGDTGRFNLLVDSAIKAANVGDGGTTGTQAVLAGASHTVGETAGSATDLADYDASLVCVDKANGGTDNDGTLWVDKGDQWECVITNTRKVKPNPPTDPPTNTPPVTPPQQQVQPQIAVKTVKVTPGAAKLVGPRGCPRTNVVRAAVTGKQIVKVTFYVDGRKVKTLRKANKGGQWVLPLNVRRMGYGNHRIQARIEFAKASGTQVKTLRLSFSRCAATDAQPKFTG